MFQKNLPIRERIFSGSKYRFLVLGREEIKDFNGNYPYIIISITDPETPDAKVINSVNLVDILRLKFHDVGKPKTFETTTELPISKTQALEIKNFVQKHLENIELIVCQCEQGVSRSAAIAGALSQFLQNENEYFIQNFWLNRYVYDVLTEVLDEELIK